MYADGEIAWVHVELTSRCNAACPMCPRNLNGDRINPSLPLTELTLDYIKRIFPQPLTGVLRHLRHVLFCGNYGDPIVASSLIEIILYLRSLNPKMTMGVSTNGSAHNPQWWAALAGVLTQPRDRVVFAIDGLRDTNHLYRRRTNFAKIMDNASVYIAAGGNAHWEFLVFAHNQHQVEQAETVAHQMGFAKFTVKQTGRFVGPDHAVLDIDGRPIYALKPADRSDRPVQVQQQLARNSRSHLDTVPISCKMWHERSIYLSAEGLVFPCCWLATIYNLPRSEKIWNLIEETGGKDAINALLHPVDTIVAGALFDQVIERWRRPSCDAGRLEVCANSCGKPAAS